MKRILTLVLFFLLFAIANPQNNRGDLDAYLTEYFKVKEIPSISAGVASEGKIIWLGARGYSDIENSVYATTNTVYRIASISKSITAVAIMQLVETRKINLDEDARKYLPYFPQKKWRFTTRQLLNHTAGIRTYRSGEFDSKEFFESTRDAVEYIIKDSLEYEPGTKYLYTTLGYNLLAGIIEYVSGLTLIDYYKTYIFSPVEMYSTTIEVQSEIIPNRARGYIKDDFRKIKNAPLADLSIKYSGGGVVSNAGDLLKFGINLSNGKLLSQNYLDSMLVPSKLKNGTVLSYGLGFLVGSDDNGKYFMHTGGGTGFTSQLIIYPNSKLAAVHLINIRDRNLDLPAKALASVALKKEFIRPIKSLADRMLSVFLNSNADSALAIYQIIQKDSADFYDVNFNELNLFGSDLIKINRLTDAIRYFRFLTRLFPEEPKAFLGLAETYNKDKNKGLALRNYKFVLKLDPKNKQAAEMVKKLQTE
jgi:CubicO group peptidase (beta-lactamase class C family)